MLGRRNHLDLTQNLTPVSDTPVFHFKSEVVISFTQVQLTGLCFKPVMMAKIDDSILRSNIDGQEWTVS